MTTCSWVEAFEVLGFVSVLWFEYRINPRNELQVRRTYVASVAAASVEVTASVTVDGVGI